MLRHDVERLQERVQVIPGLESDVRSLSREIGQLRKDTDAGFGRVEKALDDLRDDGKRNRWTLIGFALTVAGAAVSVVLAVVANGGVT